MIHLNLLTYRWLKKSFLVSLLLFLLGIPNTFGQNQKHEVRGVWVTTFSNLDWPSKASLSVHVQKKEFIEMLDSLKKCNFNAVFVQVRAAGDAFYSSPYEPWSEWLTGKQGKPPSPYYDPMQFMIEECHKRNIEFHAWLNLLRGVSHHKYSDISEGHLYKKHPEWLYKYGASYHFNPGKPEIRNHIVAIVADIAKRYEVDGIHFDDYFYPYKVKGEKINDYADFKKYGTDQTLADWRRSNLNELITRVAETIKEIDPSIQFGISPLCVWRKKMDDSTGVDVPYSQSSYDDLYADTKMWYESGLLDYIAPQIYRSTLDKHTDFNLLVDWWKGIKTDRPMYIGLAMYKADEKKLSSWQDTHEILDQVRITRNLGLDGQLFFRAKHVLNNSHHHIDSLKENYYLNTALPVQMPWKQFPTIQLSELSLTSFGTHNHLSWQPDHPAEKYVIYRCNFYEHMMMETSDNIVAVVEHPSFIDFDVIPHGLYYYRITAIGKNGVESKNFLDIWSDSNHNTIFDHEY